MRRTWIVLGLLVTAACSSSVPSGAASTAPGPPPSLVTLPSAEDSAEDGTRQPHGPACVRCGRLARGRRRHRERRSGRPVRASPRAVRDDGWASSLSLDGTYVVSTAMVGPGDTKIAWDAVPSMEVLGGTVLIGEQLERRCDAGRRTPRGADRPGRADPGRHDRGRTVVDDRRDRVGGGGRGRPLRARRERRARGVRLDPRPGWTAGAALHARVPASGGAHALSGARARHRQRR